MKRRFTLLSCFIQAALVAHAGDLHFTSEPADQTVVSGATVTLSGAATASLPVSYQWIKGTGPIPGQTGSSLSFTALSDLDGGVFKLQAKTSEETITSDPATVTVLPRPGIGISQPANDAGVPNGIAFTIAAALTNGSIVTNVAFYSGTTLLGNATAAPFQISSTLTLGDYTLKAVASALGGPVATSAPVTIHALNPIPEIVAQPVSLKVISNRTATFRLLASGPTPLTFRWFQDGAPVATSSVPSLSVTATNGAAGEYKVTVSNDYGSVDSRAVRFDIATPPNLLQKFWRVFPERNADDYNGMAYGNGRLVTTGPAGTIAMSLDGVAWHDVSVPYTNDLYRVRFYDGSFWAVGEQGLLLNSTNAINWVSVSSGTSSDLLDIAFKDGVRALIPNATIPSGSTMYSIAVGNGLFFAYGDPYSYVSTNGVNWTKVSLPGSSSVYGETLFFKGKFVHFRSSGIFTSTNGINWTNRYSADAGISSMVAGPDRLFAYGNGIVHTDDGVTFVADAGTPPRGRSESAYNGVAYFLHAADVSEAIFSSLNGIDWAPIAAPFHHNKPNVNFAKDRFFMTGASKYTNYGNHAEYGFEAGSWGHVELTLPVGGVVFGGDHFTAVPLTNTGPYYVFTSTNGLDFTQSSSGAGLAGTSRLKYEDGDYLAVTSSGGWYSSDFVHWIISPINLGTYYDVAKGDGKVVALLNNAKKVTLSENNAPFELITTDIVGSFRAIEYGNGVFTAVSSGGGAAMYSGDGRHWFAMTGPTSVGLNAVAYGDGMFIAVGNTGQAWYSFDGVNWEAEQLHAGLPLTGVAYGNGRWLISGIDGALLESGPRGSLDAPELSATLSGTTLTIQINANFGQVLRLESAATIGAPWTLVERFTFEGTPVQKAFDTAGGAEAYYRVVVE